jgi:hypothetical protein
MNGMFTFVNTLSIPVFVQAHAGDGLQSPVAWRGEIGPGATISPDVQALNQLAAGNATFLFSSDSAGKDALVAYDGSFVGLMWTLRLARRADGAVVCTQIENG